MNRKSKGLNGERDLVKKFWGVGWAAIRVAGSGSTKNPSPDILVGKGGIRWGMECKVIKEDKKYFSPRELEELKLFCNIFVCTPLLAVKFGKEHWRFIKLENVNKTRVDIATKFLWFEELITEGDLNGV